MSIILDGTTGITTPDLIDSSLTSGRVVYAGGSGNLTGSANLTFDGTILKVSGAANEMLRLDTSSTAYDAAIRLFQAGVQKANIQAGVGVSGGGLEIYSNGSTPIVFGNSAELMRITSTGLGIGTSSPAGKVDVQQSTTDMVGLSILNTNNSVGTTTSSQVRLGITNSAGVSYAVIKAQEASADDYPALTFAVQNAVTTTPTERMRITSAGFVGIGTSSPSYLLNVQGSDNTYAGITAGDSSVAGLLLGKDSNKSLGRVSYDNSDNSLQLWTNGSEKARITSGGNLLLGLTTGAVTQFTMSGDLSHRDNGGGAFAISNYENAALTFSTNTSGGGGERMRITSAGNVGIGTTSPGARLHVEGTSDVVSISGSGANVTMRLAQTSANPVIIRATNNSNNFWDTQVNVDNSLSWDYNDSEKARMTSTGSLLVGLTVNSAGSKLASAGGIGTVNTVTNRFATVEYGSGASGSFSTITISFTVDNDNASVILEVLMTGYNYVYLDHVVAAYGGLGSSVVRNSASSGTTVSSLALSGTTSTLTITTNVTHPVVKIKATGGGIASGFTNGVLPTINFA